MFAEPPSVQLLHATVSGHVQGVGFRYFVAREASRLGIQGHVRNLSVETNVEVVAQGSRPDLDELVIGLRRGPPLAVVESVTLVWQVASGNLPKFEVRA